MSVLHMILCDFWLYCMWKDLSRVGASTFFLHSNSSRKTAFDVFSLSDRSEFTRDTAVVISIT